MKKTILLLFLVGVYATAFGQYVPKGSVSKAEISMNSGKLDVAKAEIDQAFALNAKGKVTTVAKNWYLRGKIYSSIYQDTTGNWSNLSDNALDVAVESFRKVLELEKSTSTYGLFAEQELSYLYGLALNQGAERYNENDFEGAHEGFQLALKVMPGDTTALLYSGVSAQQAEMYTEALASYQQLVDAGVANLETYKTMIYLYRTEKEDLNSVLRICQQGLSKFPDDKELKQEEITTLILLERTAEAEQKLNAAIASDPRNPLLYYELGYLYDFQEQGDKALEQYKKALEVDPNHYESNYNAGVVFYNRAAVILKELNAFTLDEFREKEEEYAERAKLEFQAAMPYLEKAVAVAPKEDAQLLETLEGVYIRLHMDEKAKALEPRIKALRGEE
jgi:tetratricopeptide (TPR) repeat protein